MTNFRKLFLLAATSAACISISSSAQAAGRLKVLSAGPVGEIATLQEANEIRVVFSEPMVTLGRIPNPATAPFFRITPAVSGTFRWSGTTTLIFTPDPKKKLPFATRYEVVIDGGARSAFGELLGKPYVFSFTTPTVRLLSTTWYRRNGRFDQPVVIGLRFNQPIRRDAIAAHLKVNYAPHPWTPPLLPSKTVLEKEDPQSVASFNAKVAKVRETVGLTRPLFVFLPETWDRQQLKPGDGLLVIETPPGVPTEAWLKISLSDSVPSPAGPAVPGKRQEFVVELEPTFFIDKFDCHSGCNPDRYNALHLRREVLISEARARTTVTVESTGRSVDAATKPSADAADRASKVTLEDLGAASLPAVTYRVTADPGLTAVDGQILGYRWIGRVENWHRDAFSSFGGGHGVWETSGGAQLPFYARNLQSVQQWAMPITEEDLVPTIVSLTQQDFSQPPPQTTPLLRKLNPTADKVQSFGFDLDRFFAGKQTGLFWAAVRDGAAIPKSRYAWEAPQTRATVVQVTNLGINVKDSPENILIFVTALDTAAPVEGAVVKIRSRDNKVVWTGVTNRDGLALGPKNRLRLALPPRSEDERDLVDREEEEEEEDPWYDWYGLLFVVTAEKNGDIAYVGSDWHQGLSAWEFNLNYDVAEATPLLRGEIFTDRGVYRIGDEVHFKAILRNDTAEGMKVFPAGTEATVTLRDVNGKRVDRRQLRLSEWSSAEWTFRVPEGSALGEYSVAARVQGQRYRAFGNFLVAAYRRPDFRVDVTLRADRAVTGESLRGHVTARYLFGGAMGSRPVSWSLTRVRLTTAPAAILERYPEDRFTFVGYDWSSDRSIERETGASAKASLDPAGRRTLTLATPKDAGAPYAYTLEADVTDVSRQHIANRATLRLHPADFYIGVKNPPYFVDVKSGLTTEVVTVSPEGLAAPGVDVTLSLKQIQWHSVRRAEGNGFYAWESERKEVPAGEWHVKTAAAPAPVRIAIPNGGYYVLEASAKDTSGRTTTTVTTFYALGEGYTAWERHDHNRIDLVPEKKTYRPGETARIMIQSPWERATALLTTEREGVRTYRRFTLDSTQETVEVPITERDIPNVYVSVLLVKGRTKDATPDDGSDPGKPAFRLGYVELKVEDASKRLDVSITANREEYKPVSSATVNVAVRDRAGLPVRSEVTLWAVDYGVLSLTAYRTPDILDSVYVPKALSVINQDSRQRIISRRAITPKGAGEGGGGGDPGDAARKDFRVLAFWIGSLPTDSSGRATATVTLPESLTTYRLMAVAADRQSRFGQDETEIRINKPVLLKQTFPRFLTPADTALVGAVVHNQLKEGGTAVVTLRSLDPATLAVVGTASQRVQVPASGSREVRFEVKPATVGDARLQMTVSLLGESDAFEETLPVRLLTPPETIAAYGEASPSSVQKLELPTRVVPMAGGLHIELASTALVGLGEGARYLVEYPYGCAEQRASRTLALALSADLGAAFKLPGINTAKSREAAQRSLDELARFQCDNGGFAFWPGDCDGTSPYLTSYAVHVHQQTQRLGYVVDRNLVDRAVIYLEERLNEEPPLNESWWPAYTAWQAFTIKVLAERGRNVDSAINRLYEYIDRMPVFALSFLHDALHVKGDTKRAGELRRRMMNATLPEGGTAHVEELNDRYLLLFWSSNVRSTAIVLGSLVRSGTDKAVVTRMVRWLMQARENGRWGNTQENAWAMLSLVDYYRTHEAIAPDFRATASIGEDPIASAEFRGRTTTADITDVPMQSLLAKAPAGTTHNLTFSREGTGTLHYMTRLRYVTSDTSLAALDRGFSVERSYSTRDGKQPLSTFEAGDIVRVTLTLRTPKERRWVAVTDPLPAGLETIESMFATTSEALTRDEESGDQPRDWSAWFERGGFDHVERHDDRVNLFATRLGSGEHTYSYLARATTSGTFNVAPAHAEEMYEPEVFGRSASATLGVTP